MHTMEDYTRGFQVPVRHQREKPDHRWIQIYTRWFQTHWFQTHWFQTHWFQTDTSLALCNGTTLVADLDEEKKKRFYLTLLMLAPPRTKTLRQIQSQCTQKGERLRFINLLGERMLSFRPTLPLQCRKTNHFIFLSTFFYRLLFSTD